MHTPAQTNVTDDMRRRRTRVYHALAKYMHTMDGALSCAERLLHSLPHRSLNENTVFVAYGGGKDSSYMVAFVRFIQLMIYREHGTTFKLRIATNRHAGMPVAVMENIHRTYNALGAYDDPDVELLLIDGNTISLFDASSPTPQAVIERNRLDILMTGHRCEGEARPTFCNACNLSMVNSFGVTMAYKNGVDVIITGDSSKEQRAYVAWVRRVAAKFGLPQQRSDRGFSSFLHTMDDIAQYYFKDIYGEDADEEIQRRRIKACGIRRDPLFFSIYSDTGYAAGDHWDLLTEYLGFQFDDVAFSFTESDCANPALMAHLRGLKAEHLYNRTYEEGIAEYVKFATDLMQKKAFPAHLIAIMQERYGTSAAVWAMREKLNRYTQEVLDLSEKQLVCMIYSPFAQRGKNLCTYLMKEQPRLYKYLNKIHFLLAGPGTALLTEERHALEESLTELTHLSMEQLRTLYRVDLSSKGTGTLETPIAIVLAKDPHKAVIETAHSPQGPIISELISGR